MALTLTEVATGSQIKHGAKTSRFCSEQGTGCCVQIRHQQAAQGTYRQAGEKARRGPNAQKLLAD